MARTRIKFWAYYLLGTAVVGLLIMEIAVRLLGYSPWNPDTRVKIAVDPGGSLTQTDSLLGYRHLPGSYHIILPTGLEFDITHDEKSLRVTRPTDSYLEDQLRPELWIFGGSFTHGWSLNDHETFPWLVQEDVPDYNVINFGVGGYGTIQALLRIEDLLEQHRQPAVIVLAYSSLHDERNTFMRSRRKEVSAWNHLGSMRQPVAVLDDDGILSIKYEDVRYRAVPLTRYLAVSHVLDLAINKVEHRFVDSHEITRNILDRILKLAEAQEIPVVLAHIYTGPMSDSLMSWARDLGFSVVDISVDLRDEGMSNRPYDAHPSALANKHYSSTLLQHLKEEDLIESSEQ
ncbi:MAG: SGNH/GDSL hydrolase family protein [Rhodothermales bacterium]|nr:SGNH/GDSL hydrolase family protein [Rhodothermales bacterium]